LLLLRVSVLGLAGTVAARSSNSTSLSATMRLGVRSRRDL